MSYQSRKSRKASKYKQLIKWGFNLPASFEHLRRQRIDYQTHKLSLKWSLNNEN